MGSFFLTGSELGPGTRMMEALVILAKTGAVEERHGYCFGCDKETVVFEAKDLGEIHMEGPPRCASCWIETYIEHERKNDAGA